MVERTRLAWPPKDLESLEGVKDSLEMYTNEEVNPRTAEGFQGYEDRGGAEVESSSGKVLFTIDKRGIDQERACRRAHKFAVPIVVIVVHLGLASGACIGGDVQLYRSNQFFVVDQIDFFITEHFSNSMGIT